MRTFYTLVITQTLSIIGSRMSGIAIGIRVYAETRDAAPLLFFSFFNELPAMLGNSFAGVLVDRWNRRVVMMVADAGQALGSLVLLFSFASGEFQLWHLYAVALFQGICAMFQSPAKSASVTMLVPDSQRDRANAIQAMSFPLAGVIAPALAGVLYALVGITGVILVDLATFLVAVGVIFFIHIPQPQQSEESAAAGGDWWAEWRGGLRFLWARPALLGLVLYLTALNFLLNGPLGLNIPYLMTRTGSESTTGAILAIESLGGFIGASLLAARGRVRSRLRAGLGGMLIVGVMFLLFATARSPLLLAGSLFLLMGVLQVWAVFTSLIQIKTPPDMQGRIFSIADQFGYLGATISFLLVGPLVDDILEPAAQTPAWAAFAPVVGSGEGAGMALVLLTAGVIILGLTILLAIQPAMRRMETMLPDYAAVAAGD